MKQRNKTETIADADETMEVLVQLKGEEIRKFKAALSKSIFARRTRVNSPFARELLIQRLDQLEQEQAA